MMRGLFGYWQLWSVILYTDSVFKLSLLQANNLMDIRLRCGGKHRN